MAELLKGVPVYSAHAKAELVTPTGAAIVKTLVAKFIPFPELVYDRIGYGAGSRDIGRPAQHPPRLLRRGGRVRPRQAGLSHRGDDRRLRLPRSWPRFMDRALELGALDVFLTPIVMKKNRLATKLTLLAER